MVIGPGHPIVIMAGPCVVESEQHATGLAEALVDITARVGIPFIFKASYDKANRTSNRSFRGPGLHEGLRVLAAIKSRFNVPSPRTSTKRRKRRQRPKSPTYSRFRRFFRDKRT